VTKLATTVKSGLLFQRNATDDSTFPAGANDVVFQPSPLDLATFVRTLAMLRVQLEDFGACINALAIWRWSDRLRSTGRPPCQEVTEKLSHTLSVPTGRGGIEMPLPAGPGIEMRASEPSVPLRIAIDIAPVRHRAIERATAAGDRRGRACRPRRRSGRRKALAVTFCRWD